MNSKDHPDRLSLSSFILGDKANLEQWEAAIIAKYEAGEITKTDTLFKLLETYGHEGDYPRARLCADMIVESTDQPEHLANVSLALGCFSEKEQDYPAAVSHYTKALSYKHSDLYLAYWIHNNLGYSLNQIGRYEDAERHCKAAIGISPRHANAFKNLGLCYLFQSRFVEAAQSFIDGAKADVLDSRSLKYLEQLYQEHPEIERQIDNFIRLLEECRRWTIFTQGMHSDSNEGRRRKQLSNRNLQLPL